MKIALIAHEVAEAELIDFVVAYRGLLEKHELYAAGTTGTMMMEAARISVNRMRLGSFGGEQQIGAMVAQNDIDLLIFFRDPLASLGHQSDITALLRLCDVQCIPVATNMATAEVLVKAMDLGLFDWRTVVHENPIQQRKLRA
ncbi:methylglyoxal synthase [Paenibacillus chitinolyticus]|uniref:methylglyoxal synthase n=1 Tax=Paenibacillus chitinolyticus TaxID=79263 RepID=UPI002DBB47F1|nr:methylglyoxal synthase [Paenibacillus chitinolyticus]MEC0246237.1 methylglyoxal synthase [Paenibacillus chitinolyticus]